MTRLIGVPKPVLQHVIFCHQEDSNWPLDEGKKVKEKFDAIFNATKYNNCLEKIKKTIKEIKEDVKTKKKISEVEEKIKEEAVNKKTELFEAETKVEEILKKIESLEKDQEPYITRLNEIYNIEKNLSSITKELGGKEAEFKASVKAQEEHRQSQSEPITCSDIELQDLIYNFAKQLKEKESNIKHTERKVSKVEDEIKRRKDKESKLGVTLGELKAAQNGYLTTLNNQNQHLAKVSQIHNFEGI